MSSIDPICATLDEAWQALGEGRVEELLVLLASIEDKTAGRPDLAGELTLLTVEARLGLCDRAGAEAALATTSALPDDPSLLQARGELALSTWQLELAQTLFEKLAQNADTDSSQDAAHERLALLADLNGDNRQADVWLASTRESPAPHLSSTAFEREVALAADDLPPAFRAIFDRVPVIVDPVPGLDLVLGSGRDPLEISPDVLGLFLGTAHPKDSTKDDPPAHLRLFQRNLERIALSHAQLREEITKTLFHELAHAFGHDENESPHTPLS